MRLAEVVDRDGDVHALDAVGRDADGALEVRRRLALRGVGADRLETVRDVLRAAAGLPLTRRYRRSLRLRRSLRRYATHAVSRVSKAKTLSLVCGTAE